MSSKDNITRGINGGHPCRCSPLTHRHRCPSSLSLASCWTGWWTLGKREPHFNNTNILTLDNTDHLIMPWTALDTTQVTSQQVNGAAHFITGGHLGNCSGDEKCKFLHRAVSNLKLNGSVYLHFSPQQTCPFNLHLWQPFSHMEKLPFVFMCTSLSIVRYSFTQVE